MYESTEVLNIGQVATIIMIVVLIMIVMGDLLTVIKLDGGLDGGVIDLTYDENNMRLYAVRYSNESIEEEIVSFDMSEIIKSLH